MENTTKNRILDEALIMFSENGYIGTNLRDLAATLGLSKSALYKHYENKEAIWNAMIDRMEAYYAERFGSVDALPKIPKSCDELYAMTMGMVGFTISDDRIIRSRKLMLTEQFHDERICRLASRHFLESTAEIFAVVFEKMMVEGLLKKDNPTMLSLMYTAPITSWIHLSDREPERRAEVMARIEEYVKHFINSYKMN